MAANIISVLKRYFGFRAEEYRGLKEDGSKLSGMQDFALELKELTAEEKLELAEGAAKELGEKLLIA
jgi:hypothetical protein